jgi:DNA invertase Pin-like site-specific DNA recombinase
MPPHSTSSGAPVAYSYIRFSHPSQAAGDSLRRQTETAAAWCVRHKVRLDTATTLHELGTSAYTGAHRKNPDRHALAAFLKLVETGKVPRGSYLIIENFDRLSREHIQPALLLALNLLQAGIRIVQLSPVEMVFDDQSDTMPVMMMMMELSRGHGESAIKSERLGKAWVEKRRRAREAGTVLTHCLPRWVEEVGGKLRLVPDRAGVVKRIYKLATGGYGAKTIAKLLTREQVPAFGAAGHWNASYVWAILHDRRAVGEFQPRRKRGRVLEGPPIPGYYPAVVGEEEWHAARASVAQRRQKRGRITARVNVFAGLLKDARDGGSYYCRLRQPSKGYGAKEPVLINTASTEGRAKCYTFPFTTFERAALSRLAEIDPHEILNGDQGPDETLVLAGELARVEGSIALIVQEMEEHGESPTLFQRLREKEARKAEVAGKLAAAREKAAHPLSEAWGETQSLLAALDNAPDPTDARLRLRAGLRRIVDSVWMLVVGRGHDRLCAAQIWFAGGRRHRDYLILHRPPRSNGKARKEGFRGVGWLVNATRFGDLDLRKRDHAKRVEKALEQMDVDLLAELLEPIDTPRPGR